MKILFSITSLGAGGLERYILRFLTCNPDLNVDILCKSGNGGDLESEYLNRLSASSIIKHRIGNLNPNDYLWLERFIAKQQYDVVCDFTGNFAGLPMLCSKIAGVKRRIAFYRNSRNHFSSVFYKRLCDEVLKSLTFRFSTSILSNSQAAFDYYYKGRNSQKFKVIYNGIDINSISNKEKNEIRKTLGIPINAFLVGHTGRLDSAKNHSTIIKVANELCHKYNDVYFILIGKGIPSLAKQYDINDRILLYDFRNDIMDILPSFDLYYFPSLWEGQPNALIEAMVTGLPVIASNIDAIKESVPNSMLDKLVPPCDCILAVRLIESIYLKKANIEDFKCQEWARSRYNAIDRFNEFKQFLV